MAPHERETVEFSSQTVTSVTHIPPVDFDGVAFLVADNDPV